MSFIFHNDDVDFEQIYQEELLDAPIGAGGFVKDICCERAIERYNALKQQDLQNWEKEQRFI